MAVAEGDKGVQSLDTLASTESTPPYPKKDPDSGLRSFTPAPSSTSASTHPSDSVSDLGHGSFTPDLLTDGEVDKVGTNALGSCSLLFNDIPPSSLDDKLGPGGDDDPGGGNALSSSLVKSTGNVMDQANPFLLTDDPGGLTDDPDGGYHVIVCPVTAIGSPRRNRNRNFGTEVALDRSFRNFGRNAVGPTEMRRVDTKHTTHPAPSNVSTITHHSSRSTAAPMSSLPLPPHFCSAMIIVAPLFSCAIQSAAAALGLAALSYQPSIHHFPPVLPTIYPPTSLLLALLLNVVGCGFSTESHSPPLTACAKVEEPDASAEHDVNVADPSNVKSPE